MVTALSEVTATGVTQIVLATLNVVQTLALAVMADRSRRVRREDREERRGAPRRTRQSDHPS